MKHWNLEKLEQAAKLTRTWNLAQVLLIVIALAYIYQLAHFGDFMSCGSEDIFKNVPCLMY